MSIQVRKGCKFLPVTKYQVQVRTKSRSTGRMDPRWYPASGWFKKEKSAIDLYGTLRENAAIAGAFGSTYFLQIIVRQPDGTESAMDGLYAPNLKW